MADNNRKTDEFSSWFMGSVDAWVASSTKQQMFQPLNLDPNEITQQYLNLKHYQRLAGHYNRNPPGLEESYAGSTNKIVIEGMPPGRPKKEPEEKPKFTRANMTYGEYRRMRDQLEQPSEAWYASSATYLDPTKSDPKVNFNNESQAEEASWDEIKSPSATMTECHRSHNSLESQPFRSGNDKNDTNRNDRPPHSDDWNCSKCYGKNFNNRMDCFLCHAPKEDDAQSYKSDSQNGISTNYRPPLDDWSRPDDVQSYKSDRQNERNTNYRPPRQPHPDDWICTKCNGNNFYHRNDCFRCQEPKGDDAQSYKSDPPGERNNNYRPPRQPHPDDWTCSKCNGNNFHHRTDCFRCHEPKGDDDAQSYKSDRQNDRNTRPPRQPHPDDWTCSKCNGKNFHHRTDCFRCHEPKGDDDARSYKSDRQNDRNMNNRPPRQPHPDDWTCSKCNGNNFHHRTDCFRCHEPKGDDDVQSYKSDRQIERNTNYRPPRQPHPDDWTCPKCNGNNFHHRSDCFRCHEPKGDDDARSYKSDHQNDRNMNNRPPRQPHPDDWTCSKCNGNNFHHRTDCFRCHEPKGDDDVQSYKSDRQIERNTNYRPPRQPHPDDWTCPKCNGSNFHHRTDCFRCHEPKGDDAQSYKSDNQGERNNNYRPPRQPHPDDWTCSKCNGNNFHHRTDCFRCHEPKGDDVQSYNGDRPMNNRPPRQPHPDDWGCSKCNANNFHNRTDCFRCHEPKGDDARESYKGDRQNERNTTNRPPRQAHPDDWSCAKCNGNNFHYRTDCFRCHEPKEDNVQSREPCAGSPPRNDGFGNNRWGGGNYGNNFSATTQDEDNWDDDEPMEERQKIEKRKISSDVDDDDKSNEQVLKKQKRSEEWNDDNGEENGTMKFSDEIFNTDDKCNDKMSVEENYEFATLLDSPDNRCDTPFGSPEKNNCEQGEVHDAEANDGFGTPFGSPEKFNCGQHAQHAESKSSNDDDESN